MKPRYKYFVATLANTYGNDKAILAHSSAIADKAQLHVTLEHSSGQKLSRIIGPFVTKRAANYAVENNITDVKQAEKMSK